MTVDPRGRQIEVALSNQQQSHAFDADRLVSAAKSALLDGDQAQAVVSIAVVDDATIHDLNRRFLNHDYPTDVLSFVLESTAERLEGEVVVSIDTAARAAEEHDWGLEQELALYVIHGCLHLVGMDDGDAATANEMRTAENRHMRLLGEPLPWPTAAARLAAGKGGSTE